MVNSLIILCFFNLVLLHANEAEDISKRIPSFLANPMLMRVLVCGCKFSFQFVIIPNPTSPTIMKLHERDIRIAKESVQSAYHIEFLG